MPIGNSTDIGDYGEFKGSEAQIQYPLRTPVVADGIWIGVFPESADLPPSDLYRGQPLGIEGAGMGAVALPRHGSRPSPVPTRWPANKPLPGAVNVSLFDGHSETVRLDNLWQLYWSRDYVPPTRRPQL
jgi:prepilin-type processing-associated H-X9-DG protein